MTELVQLLKKSPGIILLLLLLFPTAYAQDIELAPVSGTYAIQNVNIIQAPGRRIELGTVVIKDGLIQSVGKSVSIPADAQLVRADSMFMYPGFIDGLSHTGVPKPKEERIDRNKIRDVGAPPDELAGIQPQRQVRTLLSPSDKSVDELRKMGFTTVHAVPHGGMLPGNGAIVLLTGKTGDEMIYKDNVSLFSRLKGAQRMYPSTVIGVMAKYRDLYRKAMQSKDYRARYRRNPSGMVRPEQNSVEEAFYPIIDRQQPVAFFAENVMDVQRVLTLQRDLGFQLLLAEVKQGWDVTGKIKSSGAKVFLSLDLPEKKEEKKDSTDMDTNPEQEALEKRKQEMLLKYYQQPATFKNNGIRFGFSTMEAKNAELKGNLRKFLEYGMTEDDLIAALTVHPAELLGVSGTMGTIEPGKMANLVVTDTSYFAEKSNVKYVFVDGRLYSYEKKKKKKSNGGAVAVQGTWSYSAETPNGTVTGKISIKGGPGSYNGTVSNSFNGQTANTSSISLENNQMIITYMLNVESNTMTIEIDVTIDGDTFEGTMSAGQFGNFPVEGEKDPDSKNQK